MATISTTVKYQDAFQSGKSLSIFRNFEDSSKCDECEEGTATAICKICDQYLCKACDLRIHNKGKRSEHVRRQIDPETERPLNVVFISLGTAKEAVQFSYTEQEFKKELLAFIRAILDLNGITSENAMVYLYYSAEDQLSQELISNLCECLNSLKAYAFVDVDKLKSLKQFGDEFLNPDSALIKFSNEKTLQLAKCLSMLSKGHQNIYIYEHGNSWRLASLVNSSDLLESQRVFAVEDQEKVQNHPILKMVELAKKPLKINEKDNQSEKQNSSIHSQEGRELKKGALSTDFSAELQERLGFLENNSSFDEIGEPCVNKNFSKKPTTSIFSPNELSEDFSLSNVIKIPVNPTNNLLRFDRPYQRIMDQKSTSLNHSDNSNQSFEGEGKPGSLHFNPVSELKIPSYFGMQDVSAKQSNNFGLTYQAWKEAEVDGSFELSMYLQSELRRLAVQGDLMITKEEFIELIEGALIKRFNRKADVVIDKAIQAGVIRIMSRKYPDNQTVTYISLQLETITIESLGWVCRSIKKDAMAPTEKLILSRIKECFDIKLEANSWNTLLNYIESPYVNTKKPFGNETSVLLPLVVSNANDPSTGADTHVVIIKGEEWACDDLGTVDESSLLWKTFTKFLDDFFQEEDGSHLKKDTKGSHYNNRNLKSGNKYIGYQKYDKKMEETPAGKAIPGGRYGCAQFIKVCGPESLRKESLGKLNLYVQEAINKGIVRYQRTLLVKNTQIGVLEGTQNQSDQNEGGHDHTVEKRMRQLKKIKDALIEVLIENPSGLSLAQIPQYLRRKINFSFNLQEMGFPKLKNLLLTMTDDVQIEVAGTNHSYASLKNPEKYTKYSKKYGYKNYHDDHNYDKNASLFGYAVTNKGSQQSQPLTTPDYTQNTLKKPTEARNFVKKINSPNTEPQNFKIKNQYQYDKKYNDSTQDYLSDLLIMLEKIIVCFPNGLEIDDLFSRLSSEFGNYVDFQYLGCENFYSFLIQYASSLVEIQQSFNLEIQKPTYKVFPKFMFQNQGFKPKTQTQSVPYQQIPLSFGVPSYFGTNMFEMPSNNYGGGFMQGQINSMKPPGLGKVTDKYQPGPIVFYGNNNPYQFDETPTNNSRSNTNFGETAENMRTPQNSQNFSNGSNLNRFSESHAESNDNFRFIENLLGENSPGGLSFFKSNQAVTSFPIPEKGNSNYSFSSNNAVGTNDNSSGLGGANKGKSTFPEK